MLQRHAARWATDACAMQANFDDSIAHAHNLHIASISLDVGPQQVHDITDLCEDRIAGRCESFLRSHVRRL